MTAEQTRRHEAARGARAGWPTTSAPSARNVGAARVRFGEPFSLREALAEAGRGPRPAGEGRVPDLRRHQPRHAGDARPRWSRSRCWASRDRALTLDQVARLTAPLLDYLERPRACPGRGRRAAASRPRMREGARRPGRRRRGERLRRAAPSRSGRSPPGGHHVAAFYRNGAHAPLRQPGDRRARAAQRRGRRHRRATPLEAGWQRGAAPARPAEVRVLLLRQARASAEELDGRARASRRRLGRAARTPRRHGARLLAGAAGAGRPPRAALASSTPSSSSPSCSPTRDPREAIERDAFLERVPRRRPPDAAAGPRPRRRVGLARAVRARAAAGRQPRPARPRPATRSGRRARRGSTSSTTCSSGLRPHRPDGPSAASRRCSMATLTELLARDRGRARRARRSSPFFDYDGTLIDGLLGAAPSTATASGTSRSGRSSSPGRCSAAARGIEDEDDFAAFLELSLGAWRGQPEEEMDELGQRLFKHEIAGRLHWEVWRLVEAHRRMGHTRRARLLGDALPGRADGATSSGRPRPLHADRGRRRHPHRQHRRPAAVGRGQGAAPCARSPPSTTSTSTRRFAYSNGGEDVPFLEAVGNPVAVEPDERAARARPSARGWPVLRCASRGAARPGPLDIARTGGLLRRRSPAPLAPASGSACCDRSRDGRRST